MTHHIAIASFIVGISTHTPLARCDLIRSFKIYIRFISTHTPLARCDYRSRRFHPGLHQFLLTHLLRGVTIARSPDSYSQSFLLTHLLRGVTIYFPSLCLCRKFLLTHLLRGVTIFAFAIVDPVAISTHTPLARCDGPGSGLIHLMEISTHTPLARCDF